MQPIGFIITFVCVAASTVIFPEDSGRSASGNARFAWHRFVSVEKYQRRPHENSILDRRPSIHCPRVPEHSADTEPARTSNQRLGGIRARTTVRLSEPASFGDRRWRGRPQWRSSRLSGYPNLGGQSEFL